MKRQIIPYLVNFILSLTVLSFQQQDFYLDYHDLYGGVVDSLKNLETSLSSLNLVVVKVFLNVLAVLVAH